MPGSPGTAETEAQSQPPTQAELQARLAAEFARLGIDADKVAASAPTGSENAVFDLGAKVLDPDGPPDGLGGGELPPTGIALSWTEQLVGDYDQNGEVNISDLTPLSLHWQHTVAYDEAGLHGGFAGWPQGDPDAGGAANWHEARVDGDANGEVNIADITPIARHWQQRLSGYRVYRKAPGAQGFTRLPAAGDAASTLSVARPGVGDGAPPRYSFSDTPGAAGQYEYYVIAVAVDEGQAEAQSNHVVVTLSAGFADTTPPVWDATAGIGGAVDNGDGTVTITWGTATDVALPPAPASPPVTYNVYYSTVTPLDFGTAARVTSLAALSWTSPQLIAGQTYYFAVRTQDAAAVPNEDTNTVELPVTVSGGQPVEDHDPPVWTETYKQYTAEGIRKIEVGNGKLIVTCAEAVDALSPPVHYDLYYVDPLAHPDPENEHGGYTIYDTHNSGTPFGWVNVIRDVPKICELSWPNRKQVVIGVRVYDSADPPNYDSNKFEAYTSPTDLPRMKIDSDFPGIDEMSSPGGSTSCWLSDRKRHKFYVCYSQRPKDGSGLAPEVWSADLDADTGEWTAQSVASFIADEDYVSIYSRSFAQSPNGELWLRIEVSRGYGQGYNAYYHRSPDGGLWQRWEPPNEQGAWCGGFDHNGFPVWFCFDPSATHDGQYKLIYRWWDEAQHIWHEEQVCDPGPAADGVLTAVRPDGVVQLCVTKDRVDMGAEEGVTLYAHIHERHTDGTWQEVYRIKGGIYPAFGPGYDQPYWADEWAWTAEVYDSSRMKIGTLSYGTEGYLLHEGLFGNWPAGGDAAHSLPWDLSKGGILERYCYSPLEYEFPPKPFPSWDLLLPYPYSYDSRNGWIAAIYQSIDLNTHGTSLFLITSTSEQSLYDPLSW